MATIKLLQFLGIAPKVSPENLKETYAQTAENVKLYSGDLIPYPQPYTYAGQIYEYPNGEDPDTLAITYDFQGNIKWILLGPVADIVESADSNFIYDTVSASLKSERRFYYSDGGSLKQSSFYLVEKWWQLTLALYSTVNPSLNTWYQKGWSSALSNKWNDPQYFTLGIRPPPDSSKLQTQVSLFVSIGATSARNFSYERDTNGVVTVKTAVSGDANYGLQTISAIAGDSIGGGIVLFSGVFKFADYFSPGDTIRITNVSPSSASWADTGTAGATVITVDAGLNALVFQKANAGLTATTVSMNIEKIGGTLVPYNHGLKTGDVITVSGFSYLAGTSTGLNATTVSINIASHKLSNNAQVLLTFTTGKGQSGLYTVSNASTNAFEINIPNTPTFSDWDGNVRLDMSGFNANGVEITKVNDTTFTYYRPGFAYPTTVNTIGGLIALGGLPQARSYVFTWYTAWNEESIASKPSDDLYIREGDVVTLTNLPTVKPSGRNNITGVRVYRTLAAAAGTDYYLLKTLWFPAQIYVVSRTTTTARIVTINPHNLLEDDLIKIRGLTGALSVLNKTDAVVTNVVDAYTFEYTTTTSGTISPTNGGNGKVYYPSTQIPVAGNTRYWGDNNSYGFVDDFDPRDLFTLLETDDYDPPPTGLRGLVEYQNNILAAYKDSTIYFSEINKPHAWPAKYAVKVEYPIMGIVATAGVLLVVTTGYPYQIIGSDPANMDVQRLDSLYPCTSRRSIATIPAGAVYAANDGLIIFRPGNAPEVLTKAQYNADTWDTSFVSSSIIAATYQTCYVARHSTGMFVYHWGEGEVGTFTTITSAVGFLPATVRDICYEGSTDTVYMLYKGANVQPNIDIVVWDQSATTSNTPPGVLRWKSKVFKLPVPANFGAARVIADYDVTTSSEWDSDTADWENENDKWNLVAPITFSLFVDKSVLATKAISNSGVFRLPTGYKSDTFEVQVQGGVRVRMIQLAETPSGLKEV